MPDLPRRALQPIAAHGIDGRSRSGLTPDSEPIDQTFVSIVIPRMQVIEQPPPLAHQTEQTAARVMILRVGLQMLCELFDTRAKERNLNFGRASVVGFQGVGADYFPLTGGL